MPYSNSADPDQTAPKGVVWSGSTLFVILFEKWEQIFQVYPFTLKFEILSL